MKRLGGILIFYVLFFCRPVMCQDAALQFIVLGGPYFENVDYRIDPTGFAGNRGFQVGGGVRLSSFDAYGQFNLMYRRSDFGLPLEDIYDLDSKGLTDPFLKVNYLILPVTVGYYLVNTPAYRLSTYTGVTMSFRMREKFLADGTEMPKPEDYDPATSKTRFAWRSGTVMEIYVLTIDFGYEYGLNSAISYGYRTTSHAWDITFGLNF